MLMTRRSLLGSAAGLAVAACADRLAAYAHVRPAVAGPVVDAARLRFRLEALSRFGRPPGGTFADGVSRVAYSAADIDGREYVMQLLRDAGVAPRVDTAGNIIARRAGQSADLPPIVFGSHIDSVPNGGNFDGALGVLASLEAVDALNAASLVTRHPLEVVVWANEEGVAFGNGLDGSRAAAGQRAAHEADQVWNGTRKADAIRRIGGDPDRINDARRQSGSVHCYLELHIEQGGTLDQAGIPIGIVEGIVAINRYEAVVTGTPNHAGTTPMPMRHDALVAAAKLVLAVQEIVTSEPGRQVGTVGQLTVMPNAPNVIPGSVRHTIELRDLSEEKIARLADRIGERAAAIARESGVAIAISPTSHHAAALAHPAIQQAIERAADGLKLAHRRLPSGAGHDAQMMATLGPMGMIFVPSVGGVSHSPREFTGWDDCARGAAVLLDTVLAMDAMSAL
jgi:beta-ureidopropionase / N-carbamoyl-L-amino-acid hydrolase